MGFGVNSLSKGGSLQHPDSAPPTPTRRRTGRRPVGSFGYRTRRAEGRRDPARQRGSRQDCRGPRRTPTIRSKPAILCCGSTIEIITSKSLLPPLKRACASANAAEEQVTGPASTGATPKTLLFKANEDLFAAHEAFDAAYRADEDGIGQCRRSRSCAQDASVSTGGRRQRGRRNWQRSKPSQACLCRCGLNRRCRWRGPI